MEEVNGSLGRKRRPKHKHKRSCQTGIESKSNSDAADSGQRRVDLERASQLVEKAGVSGDKKRRKKRKDVREEPVASGASVSSDCEEGEERAVERSHEAMRACAQRDAGKRRTVDDAVEDRASTSGQESCHGNQHTEEMQDGSGSFTPKTKRSKRTSAAPASGEGMEDEQEEVAAPHKKRKISTCTKTKVARRDKHKSAMDGEEGGHCQTEAPTKRPRVVKNAQEVALEYLHLWNTDRKRWSFRKKTQYWLLQNMYDKRQVRCVHCVRMIVASFPCHFSWPGNEAKMITDSCMDFTLFHLESRRSCLA